MSKPLILTTRSDSLTFSWIACHLSKAIKKEIDKHNQRKDEYKNLENQLNESGEAQISTTDPDSRQMIVRNNITEVAYNVQTTVDEKHNLPIDYKVTNTNDSKAMGNMLQRAKSILRTKDFTALYDKGYHTGTEFKIADDLGIEVMVAIPGLASQAPNPDYNVENFTYNQDGDYYVCPQGNKLTTPGTWHKARTYHFKRYTTGACTSCPVKDQCTKAKYGKGIQRSEYQPYINNNKERIEQNKEYLRVLVFSFLFVFGHMRAVLSRFKESVFACNINPLFFEYPANRLIFTGILTAKAGF